MIIDRVSAFDSGLPDLMPFKGYMPSMINEWAFGGTEDFVLNALVENVDRSVVVQRKMN